VRVVAPFTARKGSALAPLAVIAFVAGFAYALPPPAHAGSEWEITREGDEALARGLAWLAANQGPAGNWESNDLGLVSMGALAFLSAGNTPYAGKYARVVERALDYVLRNAKPSGLLNVSDQRRDMYNHGLSAFVLGQAHGMTADSRLSPVLDRSLKLISTTQCEDGGWDYVARRQKKGHDLSLAVMQAKALRSAMDSGFEVPAEVVGIAIRSVREHYRTKSGRRGIDDPSARNEPGQFTYDGGSATLAMAAAGVVCLQEFGEYDDWRIPKNMDVILAAVGGLKPDKGSGKLPLDAYTLYYVGQAVYQVGGDAWKACYPKLRDALVATQGRDSKDPSRDGVWRDDVRVNGKPGNLYGTAVGCFILAIPNRYLPILQEGKIDSLIK
jgi:hypothetical protein